MREFVAQMTAPYCGNHAVYESQAWFGDAAPHLKSFALVRAAPRRARASACSRSPPRTRSASIPRWARSTSTRIGELLACALGRHLTPVREPAG